MIVTSRDAGVDAGRLDGDLEGGVFDLRRVQLDLGVPFVEMAVGGDESRLGHEIDLAVSLVNDVRPWLGGHRDRCQKEQSEQQNFFHMILFKTGSAPRAAASVAPSVGA